MDITEIHITKIYIIKTRAIPRNLSAEIRQPKAIKCRTATVLSQSIIKTKINIKTNTTRTKINIKTKEIAISNLKQAKEV